MILYSTKPYTTQVENLMSIFSELLCFRNIYSSFSFLFSHLAESAHCDLRLPGLLADSSNYCHVIFLSKISAWLPLRTLKKTKFLSSTNANSLNAAIFHTMAFKMSLEDNIDKVTIPTKTFFLKVLYIVCKISKNTNFKQYARIHLDRPKIAICETVSDTVFVLISSFTTKDK